nr:hypothetical protein GCM10020092_015210 [Actinoplanes digitatis]
MTVSAESSASDAAETPDHETAPVSRSRFGAVWLAVVLALGLIAGLAIGFLVPPA